MKQSVLIRRIGAGLRYAALCFWAAICLFPVYWLGSTSLKPPEAISDGPHYAPFLDFQPVLDSWQYILFDKADGVGLALLNSSLIALASTGLTLTAAAAMIYGLTRFQPVAGWRILLSGILATRILPPMVLVLPAYLIGQRLALLDTKALLIAVYAAVNLPVAIWLLLPLFGERASDQEDAALLDGASHMRILFTILLPMLAGGFAAVGLFVFLLCWNEYLFATNLAADRAATLPPFLVGQMSMKEAQTGSETEEWSHFSAAAMLMILPVVVFVSLVQKWLGRLALR
jgi:ABC-type glycerol-3-phosphate transport system permease component